MFFIYGVSYVCVNLLKNKVFILFVSGLILSFNFSYDLIMVGCLNLILLNYYLFMLFFYWDMTKVEIVSH